MEQLTIRVQLCTLCETINILVNNFIQYSKLETNMYCLVSVVIMLCAVACDSAIVKRSYSDQSVRGYLTERTCWWNEVCKEEFQQLFRCKCPQWSYCRFVVAVPIQLRLENEKKIFAFRAPGRYYNAYCSMTNTGAIANRGRCIVVLPDFLS
ncbi:hypothetical protein HA402_016197 [Bradysia odoriphaga]|nr:hypothetical protein HA402_016197 [Bradysia odoriphaga]